MASSPGKWEVAGKDGRARKNTSGNKKNKPKLNETDLPKLDIKAPIPESKTQFEAFNKSEPTTFVVPKQESSDNDSDTRANSRHDDQNRKLEKKNKHHKEQQPTFDDVFSKASKKCDLSSVKKFISQWKQNYPKNRLAMMKELTGFLQEKFKELSVEKDPVLGNQPPDFPLCGFGNDVQDYINDELEQCENIGSLFSYCLDELLLEINKGHGTYGIRFMIQCILKFNPRVAIKSQKEYLQRVIKRKENSREALSLLWAFGQTSDHNDLEERMTVWTTFFLPVIESKQLTKYVIDYLETTLRLTAHENFSSAPVSGEQFQRIMDLTYGANFLQFPYRRQLQLLYPDIKAIVFNFRPSDAELTGVFCQLFESLNNDLGVEYVQEALNCLIGCLEKDARCHDEWRNNYLARMKESSLLLNSIIVQWSSIGRSVPHKYLKQTLQEFESVNNDLKERERHKAALPNCEASCKRLLSMISTAPMYNPSPKASRIARIFKLVLFVILVVVCVDVYKHNGYQGSKTCKVLRQYGVENVLVNAYNRSKVYAHQLESWAEKHYPHYYKKVRDVVQPASDYIITKLGQGMYFIAEHTAPARQYIHKNLPPLLEKFEAFVVYYFNLVSKVLIKLWNDYFPIVKRYLQRAWDTLAIWVPRVWSRAQELGTKITMWFYNVSPEFYDGIADGFRRLANEVVTRTPHILALIQEYLLTAWTLLVTYFSNVIFWLKANVIYARYE